MRISYDVKQQGKMPKGHAALAWFLDVMNGDFANHPHADRTWRTLDCALKGRQIHESGKTSNSFKQVF